MSYDLKLFRVEDGADPVATYQQLTEREEADASDLEAFMKRPVPSPARVEMRRVTDALKSWRPSLEEFQPKAPLPWIQLDEESLSVQFHIYEGSVGITMPYFGDDVEEMIDLATGAVDLLQPFSYWAYDPQLGRVVTAADREQMIAIYRGVDQAFPQVLEHKARIPAANRKPWWRIW